MQPRLESHVFCTSVKCAAVVHVFGGKFREPPLGDPITIEISQEGIEEVKFHFYGNPEIGHQISDIIAAYSILSRGIPNGFSPKRETLAMVSNTEHPLHACFRALNERDRFHQIYFEAARGRVKPSCAANAISTNDTLLAACLGASGHKEIGYTFDGRAAHFEFENNSETQKLQDAYCSAWNIMKLPNGHPIYWMKSVLDRRNEILMEKRRVEPFYIEKRGGDDALKIIKTPLHISKENLEKSKKYINS